MELSRRYIILGIITTLLVGPALALGAVHPGTLAIFLVLTSAALLYVSISRRIGKAELDLPSMLILGLIGFTLLQIIPLPAILVKLISPMAYEVRSRALVPMGASPSFFMPLSIDIPFTVVELGKLFLYAGVYWVTLLWTRKHGSKHVFTIVIIAGVASATVLLAHKILILDKVYGFYTPSHLAYGRARSTAPLINENHMAALLCMCTMATIGRAMVARDRSRRVLLVILAALVGGSLILTMSRGGIAAFISGQVLFILLRVIHHFKKEKKFGQSVHIAWIPVGLVASFGLALFVAQDAILGEFVHGNSSKLDLIFEGFPLIGKFFAVGVGRGAFWVGLPLVSEIGSKTTFTHAENAVIQILADYGFIVGTTILAMSVTFIVKRLLTPPTRADHSAALCALVAFGVHNLVDFNMEIPGVAVIAAALVGVLMGSRRSSRAGKSKKPKGSKKKIPISPSILRVVAAASLILSLSIGLYFSKKTVGEEEIQYRQALALKNPIPFSGDRLRSVLNRHPAAWYFPFVVGLWHYHVARENPMPWLARAIELNTASATAHFYAGRTFLRVNKLDQALLEFRIASNLNPRLAEPAANLLVSKIPRFAPLSSIATRKDERIFLWGVLSTALRKNGHEDESERADLAVLNIHPSEPYALARHARRLASRNRTDEAFQLAKKLSKIPHFGPAGARITAGIYQRLGEHDKAVAVLRKEAEFTPRDTGLLRSLAWAKQRAGDLDGAMNTASRIRTIAVGIRGQAEVSILMAELALAAGKTQTALANLRRAHALNPSNISILLRIADIAEGINDETRLIEALKKIIAIDPTHQTVIHRLSKLEKENVRRNLFGE